LNKIVALVIACARRDNHTPLAAGTAQNRILIAFCNAIARYPVLLEKRAM
jgi:hypothetical protein